MSFCHAGDKALVLLCPYVGFRIAEGDLQVQCMVAGVGLTHRAVF